MIEINSPELSLEDPDGIEQDVLVLKKKKEHILRQLQAFKFVWWGWPISIIVGAGFAWIIQVSFEKYIPYVSDSEFVAGIFLGGLMGAAMYAYVITFRRFALNARLRRIEIALVKVGADELQENIEDNFFTKLVQINFKYIDRYYLQTQEQADKSFRLCVFSSITGLLIIGTGICMMFFGNIEPAYVTTSAGVLSEFIAAVFFYLYNKTILKMSSYHQKLVITQNISLALKITDEMEKDQKNKVLELLVDRLTMDVNKYLIETKAN